ncbi:transposable element Tcb2 transposase [Trichonephila clavipes]|nr:transposable element Tcb2 transposase [Trichonephila clavipes]
MTDQRYIDEVLLPHVRLFRGAVGDKFVFMDDNATCHRALAVQDCLDSEGIQLLVWPLRSPDLNPIENVWDALVRQVAGRNYPLTHKNTLIRALTGEWDKLPQQLLDNVVESMVPAETTDRSWLEEPISPNVEHVWDALGRQLQPSRSCADAKTMAGSSTGGHKVARIATLRSTGLEHRTPDRKAWFRCPMPPNTLRVNTEYVLVKSVGPKVLWAENMSAGDWRIFPSPSVPCLNCEGGERWCCHLS